MVIEGRRIRSFILCLMEMRTVNFYSSRLAMSGSQLRLTEMQRVSTFRVISIGGQINAKR